MSDYICPDLIPLILKRSPVQTILRCRCVCKLWKDVVDSRSFIVDHLALQRPRLLVQTPNFKYRILDPNGDLVYDRIRFPDGFQRGFGIHVLVTTVHGVICLYDKRNTLLLWNPTVRRLLKISVPVIDQKIIYKKGCVFWINPSTNEFKIVIFFFKARKNAIFSSRTKNWKEIDMEVDPSNRLIAPYFLIGEVGYWQWRIGVITSFDFIQEKFETIELPNVEQLESVKYRHSVIKWRDFVSFVHWQNGHPHHCDLWALQNGSWSKMFSFKPPERTCKVLYVGEDFDRVLTVSQEGPFVLFDPDLNKPFQKHILLKCKSAKPGRHDFVFVAYDFVESLVFPDEI